MDVDEASARSLSDIEFHEVEPSNSGALQAQTLPLLKSIRKLGDFVEVESNSDYGEKRDSMQELSALDDAEFAGEAQTETDLKTQGERTNDNERVTCDISSQLESEKESGADEVIPDGEGADAMVEAGDVDSEIEISAEDRVELVEKDKNGKDSNQDEEQAEAENEDEDEDSEELERDIVLELSAEREAEVEEQEVLETPDSELERRLEGHPIVFPAFHSHQSRAARKFGCGKLCSKLPGCPKGIAIRDTIVRITVYLLP